MRLYIVAEDAGARVYLTRWIAALNPELVRMAHVDDVTTEHGYYLVAGGGYPQVYVQHRAAAIADLQARPGHFTALILLADRAELSDAEVRAIRELNGEAVPCAYLPILAERCFECWALGNRAFVRPGEEELDGWLAHYDVRAADPEALPPRLPDHPLVERAATAYLSAAHRRQRQHFVYSKARPHVVAEATYVRALVARTADTGHLRSFAALISAIAPGTFGR